MPTYSSALRNSLDSYLLKLKDILDTCATLRTDFEDSLTQDFYYWQMYRSNSLVFFNSVSNIQRNVIRAIDVLDKIRYANENLNTDGD